MPYASSEKGWNYGDIFDGLAGIIPPDRPALVHGERMIAWGEMTARSNNLARALSVSGQIQDKVAFYLRNHPAYLEGVIACVKARQVHVNINYRYVAEEVRFIIGDSDATAVVFGAEFLPVVEAIRDTLPNVRRWIIVASQAGADSPDFADDYDSLAEEGDGAPLDLERSPDDLFYIYTGGTTGLPKGVMWRQDSLRRALMNPNVTPFIPQSLNEHLAHVAESGETPVSMPACPLMHGTGLLSALSDLVAGGTIVTLTSPRLDAMELWRAVERHRIERIVIVGDAFSRPMLDALEHAVTPFDISSVTMILSSGVMWSVENKRALLRFAPGAAMVDSFGSSEALGFGLSIMTADGEMATGRFVICDNVRVITPEGRDVCHGTGELGLVAHGGAIPEGYHNDRAKTEATFRVIDGKRYSVPGDFCTVDGEGVITLVGRGSGCINTAGEKVFPEEVEETLKLYGAITDALVIGLPDERWGQSVNAVVEIAPGATLEEPDLMHHLRQHLAAYKLPKRIMAVSSMFRGANGKADYKAANAALRSHLGMA